MCRTNVLLQIGRWMLAIASWMFLAFLLQGSGVALAGSSLGCVSVDVPAPIYLPDGNLYPAGELMLCDSISYSPVATLHRTYMNGRPIGLFMSRRTRSEAGGTVAPFVVFDRDVDGNLDIVGYVQASEGTSVAFLLRPVSKKAPSAMAAVGSSPVASSLLALAASRP